MVKRYKKGNYSNSEEVCDCVAKCLYDHTPVRAKHNPSSISGDHGLPTFWQGWSMAVNQTRV